MCQLWVDQSESTGPWVDIVASGDIGDGWLPILEAVDGDSNRVFLVHSDNPALRSLAVFDVVINNTDRKGGHILTGGRVADPPVLGAMEIPVEAAAMETSISGGLAAIIGIDHGVCFNVEPKLRTVLWGWAGTDVTDTERADLIRLLHELDGELGHALRQLLTVDEVVATTVRIQRLLEAGRMPEPVTPTPVPWPVF
jgi:hypothetical protein